MFRTGAFLPLKSCTKMKRVLIDVESYTGTPTLRYCIICIKSAIYNEMCRDAQGYTGKGTMSLYFRPLRNPLIHSQLHSSWLFSCAADGELAHRTTCTETDTRAVRPDGCESKGCPDPRGRPRDAASAAQRNLVLDILPLGVSTSQFASAYILTNYEQECADPLVFERGLARGRADPSDFEGGSAHTLIKLIDLEKDTKERVLTPWIDNLAFPQQAYRTKLWRCGEMCLSSHR